MDLKEDYIPLSKWDEYRHFPSQGAMRNICCKRDLNGARDFLITINSRLYVNVEKFEKWLNSRYVKEGEKFGTYGKMENEVLDDSKRTG